MAAKRERVAVVVAAVEPEEQGFSATGAMEEMEEPAGRAAAVVMAHREVLVVLAARGAGLSRSSPKVASISLVIFQFGALTGVLKETTRAFRKTAA